MSKRPEAGPPFSNWDDKAVKVLDIKPHPDLTHTEAKHMCERCDYLGTLDGRKQFQCSGFQYREHNPDDDKGADLKSARITSNTGYGKREWQKILDLSACRAIAK